MAFPMLPMAPFVGVYVLRRSGGVGNVFHCFHVYLSALYVRVCYASEGGIKFAVFFSLSLSLTLVSCATGATQPSDLLWVYAR